MSDQPASRPALRGAVDLSAVSARTAPGGATPASSSTVPEGLVIEVTDATFQQVVNRSVQVPVVVVLHAGPTDAASTQLVATVTDVAVRLAAHALAPMSRPIRAARSRIGASRPSGNGMVRKRSSASQSALPAWLIAALVTA